MSSRRLHSRLKDVCCPARSPIDGLLLPEYHAFCIFLNDDLYFLLQNRLQGRLTVALYPDYYGHLLLMLLLMTSPRLITISEKSELVICLLEGIWAVAGRF